MKKTFFCLLLIGLLALAGCALGLGLQSADTQIYSNEAGYHLLLPADWLLLEEEADSAIFSAPEEELSLTIVNELGGETYYGLDEITSMLLTQLPKTDTPWQSSRVITDTDEAHRQLFKSENAEGGAVYLDISVLQPYPGIRYYLIFAAGTSAYNAQNTLLNDIVQSFTMDEDIESLYALMMARRAAEAEEDIEE